MRQKICYHKYRIRLIFAYADIDAAAVRPENNTVKRQRNSGPLILFNSAIVVRLEKTKLVRLINGVLLKVEPRAVNVSGRDLYALLKRFCSEYAENNALVTVVVIYLVARRICLVRIKFRKSLRLCKLDRDFSGFPFGLRLIEKPLIVLAEAVNRLYLIGR